MTKGYVYVLSNPSMPGLVKIGRSINGGKQRARDMDQTGVPTPFVVEFEALVDDPEYIEAAVHESLSGSRINASREFFAVSDADATLAIMREVAETFDHRIDPVDMADGIDHIAKKAHRIGIHPVVALSALRHLRDDSLREAVTKQEAWIERRRASRQQRGFSA